MPPSVSVKDGRLYSDEEVLAGAWVASFPRSMREEQREERRGVALGAAARIAAGAARSMSPMEDEDVIKLAKRFAQYLEKGE